MNTLAPQFLTSEMVIEASARFPVYRPLLEGWQSNGPLPKRNALNMLYNTRWSYGEPRSVWTDFLRYLLRVMSRDPAFLQEAERTVELWGPRKYSKKAWRPPASYPAYLINFNVPHWAIPDNEETFKLCSLGIRPFPDWFVSSEYYQGIDRCFSATAWAIRFLKTHPSSNHYLRRIVLLEDHLSGANSPAHAQGLIPFCRKNSRLRIERVVKLQSGGFINYYLAHSRCLMGSTVIRSFGRWILETLELKKHGMPEGSFKLFLDGDPVPEKTTKLFEAVQRDTALQIAMEICYERDILPRPSWWRRRRRKGYLWEALPRILRELMNGDHSSIIHCNFDLGSAYDPEEIVKMRRGWSAEEWESDWKASQEHIYVTEPPLPPYRTYDELRTYPYNSFYWLS